LIAIVSGAAAAVVAVIVVLALVATSGGGQAGTGVGGVAAAGGPAAADWQAVSAQNNGLATWSYGNSLVVAADSQVTAYNRVTGKVLWRTKAPVVQSHQTVFCGASQTLAGSTVVLGVGMFTDSTGLNIDCHSVIALNVATGKFVWSNSVPSQAQQAAYAQSLDGVAGLAQKGLLVEISGQTVVAGWLGVVTGYSLSDGTVEWSTDIGGPGATEFDNYVVKDIAVSGTSVYLVATEIFPDSMVLLRVDPATGQVTRKVTLSQHVTGLASPSEATIASASPLTVVVGQVAPTDVTNIVSFSSNLVATRIFRAGAQQVSNAALGNALFVAPMTGDLDAHQFYPLLFTGTAIVAVTSPPANSGHGNQLLAIDYATGAVRWTASVPDTDLMYPIGTDGSTLEVAGGSQSGQGNPELIEIDMATGKVLSVGKPRVLGPAPLGRALAYYRFVSSGGHAYGVYWWLSKSTPGSVPAVFSLNP
jgi:outer membrane protein assembly factor BamB